MWNRCTAKSGIEPDECVATVREILTVTPHLRFAGLMTIGRPDADAEQPDFKVRTLHSTPFHCAASDLIARMCGFILQCLVQCRTKVADALGVEASTLDLSMGMSHDYREAVRRCNPRALELVSLCQSPCTLAWLGMPSQSLTITVWFTDSIWQHQCASRKHDIRRSPLSSEIASNCGVIIVSGSWR